MAKRFTSTNIWDEDWFLEMPVEYKLFWYYMLSNCDHAGLFRVNEKKFCRLNGVNLTSKCALEYFNFGKQRIRVISDSVWLIEDFFFYQYGEVMNLNNRVHKSIQKTYNQYNIDLGSIRGLKEVKGGANSPQNEDTQRVKDKDKDNSIKKDTIRVEGVGEGSSGESPPAIKSFTQFPKTEDVGDLSSMQIGQAKEYLRITKGVSLESEAIQGLWGIFKAKNLTGKKAYRDTHDVYSHFLESLKYQKFDNQKSSNGTHKQSSQPRVNGKSAGAITLLNELKQDYGGHDE